MTDPKPYGVSLDDYLEHARPLGVTPDAAAQAPPPIALPAQLGRVVELLEQNLAVGTLPPGPFVLEAKETAEAALERAEAVVVELYAMEAERVRVLAVLRTPPGSGQDNALLELTKLLQDRPRNPDPHPVPALGRLQAAAARLIRAMRGEEPSALEDGRNVSEVVAAMTQALEELGHL